MIIRSKLSVGMRLPLSAGSRPGPASIRIRPTPGASIRYPACERPKLANASPVPKRVTVMGAPFDAALGFIAAAYAIIISRTAQTRRARGTEREGRREKEKDPDVKPTLGFTLPGWSTQIRMRPCGP